MLCTSNSSPPSPAGSEISVGAPSPPPQKIQQGDRRRAGDDYFKPLKRLKGISEMRERSASPPAQRSSLEGVKSFSIDDILGHESATNNNNSTIKADTTPNQLQTNNKIVRPWDHFRGSVHAVRPFLPPALFHYEQRLALDYQRHLEQLSAQAHLLRHMNMNMSMNVDIKSESGSERSSSAASDCYSPDIGSGSRLSDHHNHHSNSQQSQQSSQTSHHHNSQKTKPNGTPLDALFQMTNKNFDESQGLLRIFYYFCFLFVETTTLEKKDGHLN